MSFFGAKKPVPEDLTLLVDLGSGSIGVALIVEATESAPEIVYLTRERIQYRESIHDAPRMLNLIVATLEHALSTVRKDGLRTPHILTKKVSKAVVMLASPWYQATTLPISLKREKPFTITPAVIQEAIADNEKRFLNDLERDERNILFFNESKLKILGHTIMNFSLNGYPVHHPLQREATSLSFTLYTAASSSTLVHMISEKVSSHFEVPISFYGFSLPLVTALHSLYPATENYIALDVTGVGTELVIVKDSNVVANLYFPFGREAIASTVKAALPDTPETVALDLIRHEQNKENGNAHPPYVQKIFAQLQGQWEKAFHATLEGVPEAAFLPKAFFVTADKEIGEIIAALIKADTTLPSKLSGKAVPDVISVEEQGMEALSYWKAKAAPDPFIHIESIFLHTLRNTENTLE